MKLGMKKTRLTAFVIAICMSLSLVGFVQAGIPDVGAYNVTRSQEVKAGTILKLTMDTYLTSRTAAIGDPFTATVFEDVRINGEVAIPRGAKIEGKVSSVKAAERKSKSGTLGITFDRLVLPNGQTLNVEGQLASLNAVEQKQIDEEGRVSGNSSTKRNVVFIGGGAAGGAAIGAIAGGGSGAAIGAGVGAAAGILGSLFSKGEEAQVMSGQQFGMELLRPVVVGDSYSANDDRRGNDRDRYNDRDRDNRDSRDNRDTSNNQGPRPRTADLKSNALLKRAQKSLLDLNYYKGSINGIDGPSTRTAVRAFQRDYDLEQTGILDVDTAYQLGLVNEDGIEISPVRILTANADRLRDNTVRVKAEVEANSKGWQIYTSTQLDGEILHVYVTGAPPYGGGAQALTRYPVDVPPVKEAGYVTKVIVHGDGNPVTVSLASPSLEIAQGVKQQASSLLDTYKEAIGVTRRGGKTQDLSRLTENQAAVLVSLSNLSNSANFVESLLTSRGNDAAIKGALRTLIREARQTRRFASDSNEFYRIEKQWQDLEKDLRRLGENYQLNLDRNQD